nr:MAG TPA: hypothetical protein [Bacteriophage sp.]
MSILFFIYYNIIMFLFVPYTLCTTKVLICALYLYIIASCFCALYLL